MKPWMMALVTANRTPKTQTFASNASFTVPAGVTALSMTGHGSDGTPARTSNVDTMLMDVTYHAFGTGVAGSSTNWDGLNSSVDNAIASLNSGGTASFSGVFVDVYPDGTNTVVSGGLPFGGAIPGSVSKITTSGWGSSGAISTSGTASANYNVPVAATSGTAATGFGQTFPGGAAGAAAPTTSLSNVAVTPLATYSIVVPAGGSLTITYYQ